MSKGIYDIEFFPAMDRQGKTMDGKITSEYPAWYLKNVIASEKEDIENQERNLKRTEDKIGPFEKIKLLKQLRERNTKVRDIVNSKPILTSSQKDALSKEYKRLGEEIKNSFFDRSRMEFGRVQVKEEAHRMADGIISADGRDELFKKLNVKVVEGKISRNSAIKSWKILGQLLDENTWAEDLRPDYNYGTTKLFQSLKDLVDQTG
jgi:hypothetical protein